MLEHEEFYCYHLPSLLHVRHPKWRDLHWRRWQRQTCNPIIGMKEKYKDDKCKMRHHAKIQNLLLFWCWNMTRSSIVTTYKVWCTWDIPSREISVEGGGTVKHVTLLLGWKRNTKMINVTWGTILTIEYETCYCFDVGTLRSSIVTTYKACCTGDIPSGEISIEGGTVKHVTLLLG